MSTALRVTARCKRAPIRRALEICFASIVAVVLLSACNGPAAYPRSGEVADVGESHFEGNLQVVSVEPQQVTYAAATARSKVGFLPAPVAALRVGLVSRCELGGAIPGMLFY
jgi:hypothetical protein